MGGKLNLSKAVKHIATKAPLAALAFVLLIGGLSCGKRRPPLPPNERVVQRPEISGFQRGDRVILSWKMPIRNAPKGSLLNIKRADVYRLTEPLAAPASTSEEEFSNRSTLVAAIEIGEKDFGAKTLQYRDELQFAGQPVRIIYALRFVNESGQKAAFSNFFVLEPAASVASAPTSLQTTVTQDAIKLSWIAPTGNINGTTPVNLLGFNVYRSESEAVPAKLLTPTAISGNEFEDRFFEFKKDYFYFIRAVSNGSDGQPVESSESNIAKVTPADVFPPSAPSAVTIAATPTSISIFFPVNPETDVVGYSIYRSTDPGLPKKDWQLLTKELLTTNTFIDEDVDSGKTYYYYVTATDKFKNVSEPSEAVNETIP